MSSEFELFHLRQRLRDLLRDAAEEEKAANPERATWCDGYVNGLAAAVAEVRGTDRWLEARWARMEVGGE